MNLLEQLTYNHAPGPHFEPDQKIPLTTNPLVRLLAFYLPQFHAIPENDSWWGRGFTEWTNVTKALPRFVGHYQPRLPGDLGFYDLSHADAIRRQADLARRYGIGGFCFHHYWFAGKRLLEQPIDTLLANRDIDLPFCINWANESWTRRWDGNEKSILQAQTHSPEDDIAFARSLEPFFRDKRYIRIDGRPLLMLYRPGILPDAAVTVARWRAHFEAAGLGNPYVLMAQAFNEGEPDKYGMDAAAGFPPFWTGNTPGRDLDLLDPAYKGDVVDYAAMAAATVESYAESSRTDTRVFPGVCPNWDNEARKPGRGYCFTGSTPEKYGTWLQAACNAAIRAFPAGERLVFVNAWNEWAEGAYLEPDRHFGHAYLAETARVLNRLTPAIAAGDASPGAVLQIPDAKPHLAPVRRARRLARRTLYRLADVADDVAWKLRGL